MTTEPKSQHKSPPRFWISALTDQFDQEKDVPIASWCITGVEDQFPDWGTWRFEKPFIDTETIVTDARDINSLCADLLEKLKAEKNAQHNVSYSTEYWRILAMHWIVDLVNFSWYRWREVTATLSYQEQNTMICDVYPDDVAWNFEGYGDFNATTLYNMDFSTWVCSRILRTLNPDNVTLIETEFQNEIAPTQVPHIKPPRSLAQKILRQLRAAAKSERCVIGSIGNEYSLSTKIKSIACESLLGLYLNLLPAKSITAKPAKISTKIPDRFPAQFITLVRDLMDATLPNTLGKYYAAYRDAAQKAAFKPGKLTIQIPAFHLSPGTQFKIAHAVEAGEHLIGYQHGGSYGAVSVLQMPPETEYKSFAFITWGWHRHSEYEGNFIRLPSSQLASWRNARTPSSGKGLFVAQAIRFLPGRLSFEGDINNRTWSRKKRLAFFQALPARIMQQTNYRPYDHLPASQSDTKFFTERLPVLNIASNNFHTEMTSAKLVMIDHPGTTFFQSMAADIPTVAYWSQNAYPVSKQAASAFNALKLAGIIFDDSETAAKHVSEIWDDVDGWWQSPNVMAARQHFKDNYAFTERFWLLTWMKALWKI